MAITEEQFQQQITQLAELRGWLWCHWRAGRTGYGWRVPVEGPLGAGWPDLWLSRERDRRVILAELKRDGADPGPIQERVLQHLAAVMPEVYLWRPIDWPQIEKVLE